MALNLSDIYQEIVNELKNLPDLRRVPDKPPDSNNQFPFAFVVVNAGEITMASEGFYTALYDINIELHIERKDLPRSYGTAINLMQDIPEQLLSGLINNRFTAGFTWRSTSFVYANFDFGGIETIGAIFTMNDAKIQGTIS